MPADKVDSKDLKILEMLLIDARINLSEIAKECGISSSAIISRLRQLKKSGIIVGTRCFVRRSTLDYPYSATIGINAETQQIDQVFQAIRRQPNVVVCAKSIGKYNLLCMVIANSTNELNNETQKIKNILGVKGIAINLWVDEPYHKNAPQVATGKYEIDEIDKQIIKEMMADCRMPCTKIAKKLQVSHETVRKKIEKMRANGTIRSCTITVDWSKLGYQGTVFVFVKQNIGNEKFDTISELKKIQSIEMITKIIGAFDIIAYILVRDLRDLTKNIDQIQKIPSVGHIDVCIANFTYFSYTPIPRAPIKCDTLDLLGSPLTDHSI